MIKRILRSFELSSGLKFNLGKSLLVGVGCQEFIDSMTCKFSCKVGKLPMINLCLPIGGNLKLKAFWDPLVEKFERSFFYLFI